MSQKYFQVPQTEKIHTTMTNIIIVGNSSMNLQSKNVIQWQRLHNISYSGENSQEKYGTREKRISLNYLDIPVEDKELFNWK